MFRTKQRSAIKSFTGERNSYLREVQVNGRLLDCDVGEVLGLRIPHLMRTDDELMTFEMSIVRSPYLLDFASAYLDEPPDFTAEALEDWQQGLREKFDERLEDVVMALEILKRKGGIYLFDVHPKNLKFKWSSEEENLLN